MSKLQTTICNCGSPLDGGHDHATCGPPIEEECAIRPLPDKKGIGFTAPLPIHGYKKRKSEKIGFPGSPGGAYNYYVSEYDYHWPVPPWKAVEGKTYVIDAFSPNLNKELHVGHLRNLAIANCYSHLLKSAKMVGILGASLGIYNWALQKINEWCDFLGYHPTFYYDVLMPWDFVPRHKETTWGQRAEGCEVWSDNPGIIVTTSEGRHTYSFHDIAFAKLVNPTHYLTGAEQVEHFKSLGLGDKHLPMGLVLGADGKKMKSRETDYTFTAEEALNEIIGNLEETPDPRKLAWNVICWNFLHANRTANVKFDAKQWTQIESPGMYITYTYCRIRAALLETPYVGNLGNPFMNVPPRNMKAMKKEFQPEEGDSRVWSDIIDNEWHSKNPDPQYDLTQEDVDLMGYSEYWKHWHIRAVEQMDPAPLANFTHDLARRLGVSYHKERIKDGRYGFQWAVYQAWLNLGQCMESLGMFKLGKV